MKRTFTLVMIVVGVLALAACGSDDSSVGDPADSSDDPVTSSPPLDPDGPVEGDGARIVEPRPGMDNVMPTTFESAEPIDDGRTLAVRYWGGVEPCSVLDSVEVDETDTSVTITLYIGSDPEQPDAACIMIAELIETRVTLDDPLGDRAVIDGSLSEGA